MRCTRAEMGVRGLKSLINNNEEIFQAVDFRESRLVIDGANLVRLLYFWSGLNQNCGGEYAAFAELIKQFFMNLKDCNITPYVVLDGGSDCSNKKLKTSMERAENLIKKAHEAAVSGESKEIFPQLAFMVFLQTVNQLEVPVAQCYMEADQEIAALASEWNCPVLSDDSDFFIFNLPGGFLPLSHFQWEDVKQIGSEKHIPCKSYHTSSFCTLFEIDPQLLTTFAALAGNDYIKLDFDWTQFYQPQRTEEDSTQCSEEGTVEPPQYIRRLYGLIQWIQSLPRSEEILEAALSLDSPFILESPVEMQQKLVQGKRAYNIPPSGLKKFFNEGVAPQFSADQKVLIPNRVLLPLTQTRISGNILDVLLLKTINLPIAVEHEDLPSFNLTSRPLRQVMYGLLLGAGTRDMVMERDREGQKVKYFPISPSFTTLTRELSFYSLHEVERSNHLRVLLEALGVTEDILKPLDPLIKLPVAATCYWLQRAEPPADLLLMDVLLHGMSLGNQRQQETGNENEALDVNVIHSINQWQGCLVDSIALNQLLGCPLPEPEIACLYQGTLVHQLVRRITAGENQNIVMIRDEESESRYQTMLSIFHTNISSSFMYKAQQEDTKKC